MIMYMHCVSCFRPDLIISCTVWVTLSGIVIYKTNFFRQLWESPDVNTFFLNVALTCLGFNISIFAYLSLYGPCILKRDIDLERDMPNLVPIMTIAGAIVFFSIIAATWPVWGFLTPIFMLIHFFGASFSMMFLPSGTLGTFLFWLLFGVGGYVAHNLPHDPVW